MSIFRPPPQETFGREPGRPWQDNLPRAPQSSFQTTRAAFVFATVPVNFWVRIDGTPTGYMNRILWGVMFLANTSAGDFLRSKIICYRDGREIWKFPYSIGTGDNAITLPAVAAPGFPAGTDCLTVFNAGGTVPVFLLPLHFACDCDSIVWETGEQRITNAAFTNEVAMILSSY